MIAAHSTLSSRVQRLRGTDSLLRCVCEDLQHLWDCKERKLKKEIGVKLQVTLHYQNKSLHRHPLQSH